MKRFLELLPGILFILTAVGLYLLQGSQDYEEMRALFDNSGAWGPLVYVLILVVAVVVMPVTVMPLIPLASAMFGPFLTGVLSMIGWTIGGVIAFTIARYLGRPIIKYFISLEKLDQKVAHIPLKGRFLMLILLRITMPVDVISYAAGFSKAIGFWEFTLATVIGVSWFSFAFAYLGDALFEGNLLVLIEVGAISALVFILALLLVRQKYTQNNL